MVGALAARDSVRLERQPSRSPRPSGLLALHSVGCSWFASRRPKRSRPLRPGCRKVFTQEKSIRKTEQAGAGDIFVDLRPVNAEAAADHFSVPSLVWRRLLKAWKLVEGNGQRSTVVELDHESAVREFQPPSAYVSAGSPLSVRQAEEHRDREVLVELLPADLFTLGFDLPAAALLVAGILQAR